MSCQPHSDCTCGCCSGISTRTPNGEQNLPGRSSIAYRTGTWSTFKASMLARLSSADYPALSGLRTRDNDDFSFAYLDAGAVVLDILTFYQERLANESFLRTATQLDSLTYLSRLINYQPSPGVSASTYLAFTLSAPTGLPISHGSTAITIPTGTQVQSVPAQGQVPQTFETSAPILAKPEWNALAVQTGVRWSPATGQTSVHLQGTATQLQPGDAFLIVGDERIADPSSTRWDLRIVSTVTPDPVQQTTFVTWKEPLGHGGVDPSSANPRFFTLRQRAALFGYNALNPILLAAKNLLALQNAALVSKASTPDWIFGFDSVNKVLFSTEQLVDLDAVYSKITPGGWLALIAPDALNTRTPAGLISLFHIDSVTSATRSDYAASAKVTRVHTDTAALLPTYHAATRVTSALAHSEELAVADQPLDSPLYGTLVDLEGIRQDLIGVTAIALSGKSQKVSLNPGITGLVFTPDDGSPALPLADGGVLTLLEPPPGVLAKDGTIPPWQTFAGSLTLTVSDSSGRTGTVTAALPQLTLAPSGKADALVQEFSLVSSITVVTQPYPRTRIILKTPLLNCYERVSTTVNANVGPANAGRPVTELLGSGSAATANQTFTLKQPPLTFTSSATPTGRLSSLEIRVNGAEWKEVPTLYQQGPAAQVFETMILPGGAALINGGDGVEGSTFPTGQSNIIASYRVGIGVAGNVLAGSLSTLVDRPNGVKAVTNPMAASGGQDPQSVNDIRSNAPQSVLTLGRAVSVADYQNFAATFAGIAKASALWIPSGLARGIFVTVAAAGGAALEPSSATIVNLVAALRSYGNPHVPVYVQSFYETLFRFKASVAYDPAFDALTVRAAVLALVTSTYSFANRTFGQGVSADEIDALIQTVPGVVAANVTSVSVGDTSSAGDLGGASFSVSAYNKWIAGRKSVKRPTAGKLRICPYIPVPSLSSLPAPAEVLVLDPNPKAISLAVMA